MFSGIVETTAAIQRVETVAVNSLVRIILERPLTFDDLKLGDSVAVNGVCLTVERLAPNEIQFAVAKETLSIVPPYRQGARVNLERSMRVGDRNHGHAVSGHVDYAAKVVSADHKDGVMILRVELPRELWSMVWKKGSLAVNGVSLTVNDVRDGVVEHCLIPETLSRTNLKDLQSGDLVNIEVDTMARAIVPLVQNLVEEALRRAGVKS